ncbi:MAG: hypothetical protein IPH12_16485 [Saprospirales bacterium]|nr:hypothetical protein [Saprospirales bacterium]MBK8920175.1 hypothetical protein [Saprospirales bacterium]
MIRLALLLALLAAFSCKTSRHGPAANAPFVELKTGACFGFCPVIHLTVRNNGWVDYSGLQFAERQGRDSFQLSKDELRGLRQKVHQVNLWQYPDQIRSEVVDAPTATLTVFKHGQTKSVSGSIDRPEPLLELENDIKNLAEAHGFQVKRGINPNEPPIATRREVRVKLRPEINAGNWIMQFSEFRLQLIRRVSEENIWLIAYDPKQIAEPAVLELFKSSDGTLEAQPAPKD